MSRRAVPVTLAAVAALVAVGGIVASIGNRETTSTSRNSALPHSTASLGGQARVEPIRLVETSDHLPSQTVVDWVTYADHVLVVVPEEEIQVEPSKEELDRGEGIIGRRVSLSVVKILWSRADALVAPTRFDWDAFGWAFTNGNLESRTRMGQTGSPRIELGHQYIVALVWEEARCSPGDAPEPAQWRGLGAAGVVAFDGGVIGQGEVSGRFQDVREARQQAAAIPAAAKTVSQEMVGLGSSELEAGLRSAVPREPKTFSPAAPCD